MQRSKTSKAAEKLHAEKRQVVQHANFLEEVQEYKGKIASIAAS